MAMPSSRHWRPLIRFIMSMETLEIILSAQTVVSLSQPRKAHLPRFEGPHIK